MKDQYRLLIFAPHIVLLNTVASLVKSKTLVKLILQCMCEHSHICFGMCIELWFLNVIPWAGEVARLHPFNAKLRQGHAQLKSRFHSSDIIFFIFSSTLVLTSSCRRSLYTFYHWASFSQRFFILNDCPGMTVYHRLMMFFTINAKDLIMQHKKFISIYWN